MDLVPLIAAHVVPFVLVAFRLAGLFLMAPLLSSVVTPMRVRGLLVMMLAAATYPAVPMRVDAAVGELSVLALGGMLVSEALIGFSIGMLATTPLMALEMSGVLMGQQMGLGLARVYNPEADYDIDVLGQLLFYIASGVFFALGGLDALMSSLLHTFERVPIGGFGAGATPVSLLAGVLTSSFELALRVSAPVTGVVFLLVIAFGAITKTMPQINIMSVGFTIKILAGVTILSAAVYAVQDGAGRVIADVMRAIDGWARGLGP